MASHSRLARERTAHWIVKLYFEEITGLHRAHTVRRPIWRIPFRAFGLWQLWQSKR
jgi:hypothetical protein